MTDDRAVRVEQDELDALVAALRDRYGYDFEHYAQASFQRRIQHAAAEERVDTVAALTARLVRDPLAMRRFLGHLSVHVTSMFRDADFFREVREVVVPWLRTFPFVRIWHAGCATGEEVYSMCILLEEAGIYDRCRIYATDLSELVLHRAKLATYPLSSVRKFTENYQRAGGTDEFSRYYTADHEHAIVHERLRKNVVFSLHNLASDASFNEFHFICCRNVLIYFDAELRDRALSLFDQSLVRGGHLALGKREALSFSAIEPNYEDASPEAKIYRKRVPR